MFSIDSDDAAQDGLNPYIVFSDFTINLVLILVFVVSALVLVGQAGWEEVRYRDAQRATREAIDRALAPEERPTENFGRNDPPGVQRWVFNNQLLFQSDEILLSDRGRTILVTFAGVLRDAPEWRRIRIEGHTRPTLPGQDEEWELSTARSAVVARVFTADGDIPPWCLAVSGRAGQSPVNPDDVDDPANQRVEILLEYSQGQPCLQ